MPSSERSKKRFDKVLQAANSASNVLSVCISFCDCKGACEVEQQTYTEQ